MKEAVIAKPDVFGEEAVAVLQDLRAASAAVIAALPGNIARAADLQRALRVDMKLSWKLFKLIKATDLLSAGAHVPGQANVVTFLKAAARQGVQHSLIEQAGAAFERFQGFVEEHAGERGVFDSMVTALAAEQNAGQLHFANKRAAFRANRHIWGIQAKTLLRSIIVEPSSSAPDMITLAIVQGYVHLQRLRSDAPLLVSRDRLSENDGTVRRVTREPLDPEADTSHGIALLQQFCSQPLPKFRTVTGGAGFVHGELLSNGVGNRAAVTFIHGHAIRQAGYRYRDERNDFFRMSVLARIPCEVLVFDLLVREDTFGRVAPVARVYAERLGEELGASCPQDRDILPLEESVVYLGKGPSVLCSADVPRYPEMAAYALARLGSNGDRFDVYRCRVEYPVLATTVRVIFSLPPKPTAESASIPS